MENIGGQVLRLIAIVNSPRDERIHAFEIVFVKPGEAGGIALRGLDQAALGSDIRTRFQCGFPSHLRL